jgi:hypothetical protein
MVKLKSKLISFVCLSLPTICNAFSPGLNDCGLKPSYRQSSRKSASISKIWAMKTYVAKDFSVNWQKPDAKGNFGKVFFGTQGIGGLGGQVVVKCPNSDQFALTVFTTEKAVNEKLDKSYSNPRWAKFLGDVVIDGSTPLPNGVGRTGLVYKRETGAGNSLEDFLLDGKDLAGKLGVRKETGVRPDLCKKVVGELLLTCVQMHKVGVIHRYRTPNPRPAPALHTQRNRPANTNHDACAGT